MTQERNSKGVSCLQRRLFLTSVGWAAVGAVGAGAVAGEDAAPRADFLAGAFVESPPPYRLVEKASGKITLWGHGSFKHDFLGKLVRAWIDGFRRYQPEVEFENRLYGTASAIGALCTGAGNLAILGEEIHPDAALAFERAKGYPPTGIQIATGSLDVDFFDYAHMIFVHESNPLARLTVAQLEAVFGTERKRGLDRVRSWDQLGLSGQWRGRRIQPYSWQIDDDFGLFFRAAVLGGSHRWNPEVREFVHVTRPDGSLYERGEQILDTLAQDRFGIAISNVRFAKAGVKALALAPGDGTTYYRATPVNLISQKYPLTRIIPAFIDRVPGKPLDAQLREFLRYVLSRDGQRALVAHSGYLPLGADAIREQLRGLV